MGHLDAVDEGVLPADTKTIDIMRDEAMHLSHMIEDLRTLSLADAGELSLTLSSVQPGALLQHSATAYQPAAQAAGIEIAADVAPNLPDLTLDSARITQVLGNLVDNALLHTPKGGRIMLSAKPAGEAVEIRVRDSGPGIAEAELELVFERLYRSDKSRQRNAGGSGLGLAIAKSVVEAHCGTIRAESSPGEGTTMVVTLPRDGGSARSKV